MGRSEYEQFVIRDYLFEGDPRDLYKIYRFGLPKPVPEIPGIVMIDDKADYMGPVGRFLYDSGYTPIGVHVNSNGHLNRGDIEEFALRILGETDGHLVMCDKGLAKLDGIELTRYLSTLVPTILVTGEPQTRETHRVGHVYIEKPLNPHSLIQGINMAFQLYLQQYGE